MGHTDTNAISVSVAVVGQSEAEEKQKEEEEVRAEERSERRRNESRNSSWGDPKVTNLRGYDESASVHVGRPNPRVGITEFHSARVITRVRARRTAMYFCKISRAK